MVFSCSDWGKPRPKFDPGTHRLKMSGVMPERSCSVYIRIFNEMFYNSTELYVAWFAFNCSNVRLSAINEHQDHCRVKNRTKRHERHVYIFQLIFYELKNTQIRLSCIPSNERIKTVSWIILQLVGAIPDPRCLLTLHSPYTLIVRNVGQC
jgi:hypothetical protein